MSEPSWVKSSYSGSQANCVEIAAGDHVMIRDTQDRTGPVLRVAPSAWRQFARHLKTTERR